MPTRRKPVTTPASWNSVSHGLEAGGDAIAAYGSLFGDFYDTMLDVAVRCVDLLNKAEGDLASSYAGRLQAVQSAGE